MITDGKGHGNDLDEKVISCVRDALAASQPAPRIIAPDTSVRPAFIKLQDAKDLEGDAVLQEYVTSLKLRYAVFVTPERGESRTWQRSSGGGGGFIATDHSEWYALSGLVMDLSSRLPIGSVRAETDATSGTMALFPLPIIVWLPQWTREGKVCVRFGREVARLLRDDKFTGLQNESQRTRMPSPDPAAVAPPDDQSPETPSREEGSARQFADPVPAAPR